MNAIEMVQGQKARRRLIVGALAVAGAIAIAWLVMRRDNGDAERRTSSAAGSAAGAAEMEGMSGMDMKSDGSVSLTASELSQFGVTFDTVKLRTLQDEVRATGTVALDETRIAQITPRFSGFVERLFVNATGQPVRRGQPVAAIYSPELAAEQEELLLAARLDRGAGESRVPGVAAGTPNMVGAARSRLRAWGISDAQINSILRTGRTQRALTLYSPVSGFVVEKNVVQGQAVVAGMQLMTIADISTVWVEAEVREADAASARVGAYAIVELNAFPGRPVAGRVSYVYPTLQAEARTLRARIVLPNPGGRIKPGMYAAVRLTSPAATTLTIPAPAVIETGERSFVFVDMGGGQLMPHNVRLGRKAGDFVEVLSGVSAGQRVVTSAQFLLDSESNLGEVMRSMIGTGGASRMEDMKGMQAPAPGSDAMKERGADMKGMKMPSAARR